MIYLPRLDTVILSAFLSIAIAESLSDFRIASIKSEHTVSIRSPPFRNNIHHEKEYVKRKIKKMRGAADPVGARSLKKML